MSSIGTPELDSSDTKEWRNSRGVHICGSSPAAATTRRNARRTFVDALFALVKGQMVCQDDVYNAWALWMIHSGHALIVTFDTLPPDVQAADQPFVDAIRVAAAELDATE